MTVLLFVLIPIAYAVGVIAAWRLRGLLAETEARQLTVALGGAVEDYMEEHNRWADAEFRAVIAEEALRQHGIDIS